MSIPLVFSFWFMVAAYVIHVIDESLLGGSFVEKVQAHWWPQYSNMNGHAHATVRKFVLPASEQLSRRA